MIRQDASAYLLNVSIPGNVKADVYIPALDDDDKIFIDGTPANEVVNEIVREGSFWKLPNLGSGSRIIERRE